MGGRLWLLPVVLSAIGIIGSSGGICLAQPPAASVEIRPSPEPASRHLSLQPQRQGGPLLWISYPWKLHQRVSLELYLATGPDTKRAELRPMFFLSTFMQGQMTTLVYDCLDRAEDAETRRSYKAKDIDFEIIGRRNAQQRPSVIVVRRIQRPAATPDIAAALPALNCWAISQRLLCVDLPADSFARAGLLYVWLLRGDQILWTETIDWPGSGK